MYGSQGKIFYKICWGQEQNITETKKVIFYKGEDCRKSAIEFFLDKKAKVVACHFCSEMVRGIGCEPVPLEWQQDTRLVVKFVYLWEERTEQYRATKTTLWGSDTQLRRGGASWSDDSLLWIESTEGLGKSKLFWKTKSWFFRLGSQGSLRGNLCGLFEGENHRKPEKKTS